MEVLIADADEEMLIKLEWLLETAGVSVTTAWNTAQLDAALRCHDFDVILIADHPPELSADAVLRRRPASEVIVLVPALQRRNDVERFRAQGIRTLIASSSQDQVLSAVTAYRRSHSYAQGRAAA